MSVVVRAFWLSLPLLCAGVSALAQDSAFTAGAEVVILTGLPGDVESEKAFEDQTRRLLEALSGDTGRPQRVHLLSDSPQGIALPPGLTGELMAATRAGVLALSRTIDRTVPLVVFAWGHGGQQGQSPVFHVRGPRLVPEDLAGLARGSPAARFVLFFRSSGAFARALAAQGREVLASENDVAFRSDPVGLPLLLKILAERPRLPLVALGARLGRATVDWYDARNLARQEDPTLWVGDAPARALVQAGAPEPEPSPPATSARAGTRPPAWHGIAPVAPQKFPEADAVVLSSRTGYTLGEDPAIASESDEFIQILTEEGKRYGDFDVAYSPPFETVTFLDCEVMRPDGVLERLDPEGIRDSAAPPLGDYLAPSRKVFSLPGVAPGAILRVHLQREWKRFPLPHVSLEIPLGGEAPVVRSELEVRVSSRTAFHFAFRNVAGKEPEVSETRYGRVHSWRFENLAAPSGDVLVAPNRLPRLLVSTFPDWEAFAGWYASLIREADRVTPEIAAKAKQLTRECRDDRERVVAVYHYVTSLRYVAVPLGVNSHRPHAAANVLRNRYGDCKDKANLLNTLLRSLGIEADLVLVPRFTQAHEATPGLAFNHAISRVRLGSEVIWADTTDDVCRFGLLPPGDPGRKVLVIDGRSAGLTDLPRPDPAGHKIWIGARIEAGAGGTFTASLEARTSGYADYQMRSAARALGGSRSGQPILAESLRPAAGVFAMARQTSTAVAALGEEFRWHGEGTFEGLAAPLPSGDRALLRAPFWVPREWDLALHQRSAPLFLNQGYPVTLEEEVEVLLPPGVRNVGLPAAVAEETGPLRWRIDWSRTSDRLVAGRLRAELSTGELSADETVAFQQQLRRLQAALAAGATYGPGH